MTELDAGKLIATQAAMKEQLDKVETVVNKMRTQQELLFRKVSIGKGFAGGLIAASGIVGSVITVLLTKFTGGQ